MTDERLTNSLSDKIDVMIRLFALSLFKDDQTIKERAILLSKAGLTSKEISVLCDTTPNAISVTLSAAKKEKAKGT